MKHECPQCSKQFECGSNTCASTNVIPCSKRCWKRVRNKYARIAEDKSPSIPQEVTK